MKEGKDIQYEIDLSRLWEVIMENMKLFLMILIACGTIAFGGTKLLIRKTYSATASVVIVSNDTAKENVMTYNDVQLSQKLVSTYARILMSETVGDKVLANLRLDKEGLTSADYKKIVVVNSADNTEVLDVTATTDDPVLSAEIANEAVKVFSNQVYDIMNIRNVTILDTAKVPIHPSGPNTKRNTALGVLFGALICALITAIKMMRDTTIKTEDEAKDILNYPIIGVIPEVDMTDTEVKNRDGKSWIK